MPTFTEKKTAWTPGPWRRDGVFSNEPMNIEAQAFDGSWKYVCIAVHGGNPEQREANAKLIAKAPEMAEVLQVIADVLRKISREVGGNENLSQDAGHFYRGYNAVLHRHQGEINAPLQLAERILREAGAL